MGVVLLSGGRVPRGGINTGQSGSISSRWSAIEALGGSVLIAGEPGDAGTAAYFGNYQDTYDVTENGIKVTLTADGNAGVTYKHDISSYLRVTGQGGTAVPYVLTCDLKFDPTMSEVGLHASGTYNASSSLNWKGLQVGFHHNDGANDGAISYETWFNPTASKADATSMATTSQRTYTSFSTGQTNNQPFLPRGLQSKVVGTTTAQHVLLIPYGTRCRVVHEILLNVDESYFEDWNTQIGATLAAGVYHRMTTWVQIGATKHCIYWRVPLDRTFGANERRYLKYWGVEFDTSSDHQVSTGTIRFTGTPGTSIAKSQKVYTLDGLKRFATESSNLASGTAQSGSTSTTLKMADATNVADDYLKDATVTITAGTGAGQTRIAQGNVQSTDVLTVTVPWTTTPDNTSQYTVAGPWTIDGSGTSYVPGQSSLASGTPKTSGYPANISINTDLTFSPGSVPSGLDSNPIAYTAFTGGQDVAEAPGGKFWYYEMAILKDYVLPVTPTDDTLIFEAIS